MAVELKPRIVVIGVGGAGGNAINNMIESGLRGVEFVAANTDAQALLRTGAPVQIQLGTSRTAGLGAGANPDVGAEAASESADELKNLLRGAHMCFIAAGMGGGTGTGAAPVIARIAKDLNILTVGVVTKPFEFEGRRRMSIAERGLAELKPEVDTLIIIPNQNLKRLADRETTWTSAFKLADEVLHAGVRGITDLMVMPGLINLDFADVRTVMAGMGTAMMGTGEAEGEGRGLKAAKTAVANPLLDDVTMRGAKGVLINITGGTDLTLFEVDEVVNEVRREVDPDAHIILGSTFDDAMTGKIRVAVVAAGVMERTALRNEERAQPAVQPLPPRHAPEPGFTQAGPVSAPASVPPPAASLNGRGGAAPPEGAPAMDRAPPAAARNAPPPVAERAPPAQPVIRTRPAITEDEALDMFDAEEPTPATPPSAGAAPEPAPRTFASLFGRKSSRATETVTVQPIEDEVDDSKLDDELEIPAFLRRSAGN